MFFVLLASFFWVAYAMDTSRTVHYTLPVTYVYSDHSIVLSDSLPSSVSIEMMDKGSQLRTYVRHPLSLHLNITDQTTEGEGLVTIPAEELRRSIAALLQGTTTLLQVHPDAIEGAYYKQHTKTVPVRYNGTYHAAQQYHINAEPTIIPCQVNVYGPQSVLDTLSAIYTSKQDIMVDADSLRIGVAFIAPHDVRISETEGVVAFRAEEFTEKKLVLPVIVTGTPKGKHLHLFPTEVEVLLSVAIKQFNVIGADDVQVLCAYPTSETDQLPLTVSYSHSGIFSARVYPTMIDYLVEEQK